VTTVRRGVDDVVAVVCRCNFWVKDGMRKVAHTATKCGAMSIEHNVDAAAAVAATALQFRHLASKIKYTRIHLHTYICTCKHTHTHIIKCMRGRRRRRRRLRLRLLCYFCSKRRRQVQIKNCYCELAKIVKYNKRSLVSNNSSNFILFLVFVCT